MIVNCNGSAVVFSVVDVFSPCSERRKEVTKMMTVENVTPVNVCRRSVGEVCNMTAYGFDDVLFDEVMVDFSIAFKISSRCYCS